jgi:hypothetical protein
MSIEKSRKSMRRTAGVIVLVIFMAAAIGFGSPARAEEDPVAFCRRMLIGGLVKAVAFAVITPADFNFYFVSSFAAYEWCLRIMG